DVKIEYLDAVADLWRGCNGGRHALVLQLLLDNLKGFVFPVDGSIICFCIGKLTGIAVFRVVG
ncbi:MAG: hypothetical protein Q7O66_06405, partial [Dehalococcoidia bacterium]|nr:hypothetical protein [Dehalococcoidia bacterium]